jgi:ribonuclease HI
MYDKVTLSLTETIKEVKEYHTARYGAPGQKRKKKKYLTPEAVKAQNEKNRIRHIQNLMLCNFDGGYHLVLRYLDGNHPENYEEAEKNLKSFRGSVTRSLKDKGIKFHYIAMTERGKKKGHLHHHVIVQNLEDVNIIAECMNAWKRFGTFTIHPMSAELYDKDYSDLAAYIVKKETKEEQSGSRYHVSRGLKKPEVIKKETLFGEIREPEPPKGWFIDYSTLITGINPYTGKKYQRYYMRTTPCEIIKPAIQKEVKKSMKEVNLYIEAQVENGCASGIYIVEFIKQNGEPVTRTKISSGNYSRLSMTLRALIGGVSILNSPARIKVFTSNTIIRNAIKNDWMHKWKDAGWKNNKGQQVNCAGLWNYLEKITSDHELIIADETEVNSYHSWALDEIEKEKGRKKNA